MCDITASQSSADAAPLSMLIACGILDRPCRTQRTVFIRHVTLTCLTSTPWVSSTLQRAILRFPSGVRRLLDAGFAVCIMGLPAHRLQLL